LAARKLVEGGLKELRWSSVIGQSHGSGGTKGIELWDCNYRNYWGDDSDVRFGRYWSYESGKSEERDGTDGRDRMDQ
jgi:hypothetical protein